MMSVAQVAGDQPIEDQRIEIAPQRAVQHRRGELGERLPRGLSHGVSAFRENHDDGDEVDRFQSGDDPFRGHPSYRRRSRGVENFLGGRGELRQVNGGGS